MFCRPPVRRRNHAPPPPRRSGSSPTRRGRSGDVVGFAVHAVDDQIAAVVQFVGQPLAGHAADDGSAIVARLEHRQSRGWPLMARCMVRIMSPRSPRARKVFSASAWMAQVPGCTSSARPRRCKRCRRPISSSRRWRCSLGSLKRSICTRPSSPASRCNVRSRLVHRCFHLALQGLLDLQFGARPQPFGQLGGPVAEAVGDVVAGDDEVFAGVVAPAHDQVGVRVVGVPVIDRHPIQPCSGRLPSGSPDDGCRCAGRPARRRPPVRQ